MVPTIRMPVNRRSAAREPGSSSSATTTSLNAMPMLRTMKTRPVTTGQTASDDSGSGMRLERGAADRLREQASGAT